jgi:hypothetical protein
MRNYFTFTRQLGGPMDYTPGIFEIKMSYYDKSKMEQVHTTLAKQLCTLPCIRHYKWQLIYLKTMKNTWMLSVHQRCSCRLGWKCISWSWAWRLFNRSKKTKGEESWFLGAITDENARKSEIKLDFLTKGQNTKQQSMKMLKMPIGKKILSLIKSKR